MLYSRPQLALLLLLGALLLAGLAAREWRAGFPQAAARLEAFDRDDPGPASAPVPLTAPPRPSRPPPAAKAAPAMSRADNPSRPDAPADPRPLDLNEATVEQLARLPGVGRGLAGRIIAERQRRGRFEGPEGLRAVLGMGPRKLAAVRDLVTVAP